MNHPTALQRHATLALLRASIQSNPDVAAIQHALNSRELDWNDVIYVAAGHGLTPLLYKVWRGLLLDQPIPREAYGRIEKAYQDNATRNQDAHPDFAEVVALMERVGVEFIVLKGLPLLQLLYDDPAERVLYDFDLLVASQEQAQIGFNALLAAGFTLVPTKGGAHVTKHLPSLWRLNGFVRKDYLFDPAQPRPVELHLTLWDTDWRGLRLRPLQDLWRRSQVTPWDGLSLRILSHEDAFLHLSVHLATHLIEREARVGQALDVARFLTGRREALDWDRIITDADSAQVTRFVYLAIRAVHALTPVTLPPDVWQRLRAPTPSRLRAWAEGYGANDLMQLDYRAPDLSRAYALTFAATNSLVEKFSVVRFAFFPPLEELAEQYHAPARRVPLYARHIGERGRDYLSARWRHIRPAE